MQWLNIDYFYYPKRKQSGEYKMAKVLYEKDLRLSEKAGKGALVSLRNLAEVNIKLGEHRMAKEYLVRIQVFSNI